MALFGRKNRPDLLTTVRTLQADVNYLRSMNEKLIEANERLMAANEGLVDTLQTVLRRESDHRLLEERRLVEDRRSLREEEPVRKVILSEEERMILTGEIPIPTDEDEEDDEQ